MEDEKQRTPDPIREDDRDLSKLADEFAARAVKTVKLPDAGISVLNELATLRRR